jgi:hypothetical protein
LCIFLPEPLNLSFGHSRGIITKLALAATRVTWSRGELVVGIFPTMFVQNLRSTVEPDLLFLFGHQIPNLSSDPTKSLLTTLYVVGNDPTLQEIGAEEHESIRRARNSWMGRWMARRRGRTRYLAWRIWARRERRTKQWGGDGQTWFTLRKFVKRLILPRQVLSGFRNLRVDWEKRSRCRDFGYRIVEVPLRADRSNNVQFLQRNRLLFLFNDHC